MTQSTTTQSKIKLAKEKQRLLKWINSVGGFAEAERLTGIYKQTLHRAVYNTKEISHRIAYKIQHVTKSKVKAKQLNSLLS